MPEMDKLKLKQQNGAKDVGASLKNVFGQRAQMRAEFQKIRDILLGDTEIQAFIAKYQPELTTQIFDRDLATIYEYYLQKQKAQQGLSDVHPGYDPELLFVDQQVVIQYHETAQTKQREDKLKAASRIQVLGMPKELKKARMGDFQDADAGMLGAVLAVTQFIDAYTQDPQAFHPGLYLQGPYGVGKTYLLGAMANQLAAEGVEVLLVHYPTLAANMKESIGDSTMNMKPLREKMRTVAVFVIDDIGAEIDGSGWVRDDVLSVVLDYRMQNGLTTFFTSNFSMAQLEDEHFTNSSKGAEPVKAGRLMQRIKYLAHEMPVNGPNRRLNQK